MHSVNTVFGHALFLKAYFLKWFLLKHDQKLYLLNTIKDMKQQLNNMEMKQRKFGNQSAKTRSEMAAMMREEAVR